MPVSGSPLPVKDQSRSIGNRELGTVFIPQSAFRIPHSEEVFDPPAPAIDSIDQLGGYGKRTKASEYRIQNRGGTGIFTVKRTQKTGDVVGIKTVVEEDELMLISNKGDILRLQAADIPIQGRSTQGVRLISIEEGEGVVGIARMAEKE